MKKIDCSKNCRKTDQMRSSSNCMKIAFIREGQIIYSCDANIKSPEEISYYNCQFIDNGIKSECKTCSLPCITKKQKTKSRVLRNMNILGGKEKDFQKESSVATYARGVASDGLSGKPIDIEKFKLIYKILSKNKHGG